MSRSLEKPPFNCNRNVHIYNDDGHIIGGLWKNKSISNATFYEMCGVFIITDDEFTLFRLKNDGSTGAKLRQNRNPLEKGSYIILSDDRSPIDIEITSEKASRRVITKDGSAKSTTRDGYKIINFFPDRVSIDGRQLSFCCRNPQDPNRVPNELLRWHFLQTVLARMKGAGEKPWDMNYPDGEDIMGGILEGPDAAERMEAEMFTRLGAGELHYSKSPEVSSP